MKPFFARVARGRACVVDRLEPRNLLTGFVPTPAEQAFLEQLNDARANPAAYGASIGLDLSGVAPSPPLAFDFDLIEAARLHSEDMNNQNYFDHVSPQGVTPDERVAATGYAGSWIAESIAAGTADAADTLALLITDAGVPDLGHRRMLLSIGIPNQEQVGVGTLLGGTGSYSDYWTIDSGQPTNFVPELTGAVYTDANGNGHYDEGEGVPNVQITVAGVGTFPAYSTGGFDIPLGPGTYSVTASGPGLAAPITQTVTIGSTNVKLDFVVPTSQVPADLGQAAQTLTHSSESYSYFITQAYLHYLGRAPDSQGLNYWIDQMQNQGLTDERLEAGFLGSAEYIADHGGTGSGWVQGMYHDLLDRAPDPQGLNYWVTQLQNGAKAADVAYGFAASPERETQRINGDYETYLGRAADPGGLNYWLSTFLQGLTNEDLVGGFVGSAEYFNAASKGNGDPRHWIDAAYQDVLHRTPSTSEEDYWLSVLG